jgi:hypothetical protein
VILQIDPVNGLIFVIGCLAAYAVHRRTAISRHQLPPAPGAQPDEDLVPAITAGAAVVATLVVLFGVGGSTSSPSQSPGQGPVAPPTVTATVSPMP